MANKSHGKALGVLNTTSTRLLCWLLLLCARVVESETFLSACASSGKCFYTNGQKLADYDDQKAACASAGYELATIDNSNENDILWNLVINNYSASDCENFVRLALKANDGGTVHEDWYWDHSTPVYLQSTNAYQNWDGGQRDNVYGPVCGGMLPWNVYSWQQDGPGAWFDHTCTDHSICYACMINDPPTSNPTASPTSHPTAHPTTSPTSHPTHTNHLNKATRGEFYLQSLTNIQKTPTSQDIIRITLPFNASNRTRGARVFTQNCTTGFDSNHVYFHAATTNPTSSVDDGYIQFNTTIDMNITALNGTAYWNSFSDGSIGGWAEVCVETYLSLTSIGNPDEEVNFVSNVLNVSVSLEGSFVTMEDISVKRENVIKSASTLVDYSDFIMAYQCDRDSPRDEITAPPLYTQGDKLVICVKDTDGGIIQVEDIKNLAISQTGTAAYKYIVDNQSNSDITTVECISGGASEGNVCIAELTLLARFFSDGTPEDLIVTGVVDVVRGGYTLTRTRALGMTTKQNIVEESVAVFLSNSGSGRRGLTTDDSNAGFNLSVKVGTDDVGDSSTGSKFGLAGLMPVVLGAVGAAVLV